MRADASVAGHATRTREILHVDADESGSAAERTAVAVERALSSEHLLVQWCEPLRPRDDLPSVPRWMARGPDGIGERTLRVPVFGFGIALDDDVARASAVAEVVERCAVLAPAAGDLLVRAPYVAIDDSAVAPASFPLYSEEQLRGQDRVTRLADGTEIDWRWARSLTRSRDVLVPAALVHLSLVRRPPNTFVAEGTATGTACHVSAPQAVLAALCEVLERDAVMAAWLAAVPARAAAPDAAAAAVADGPLRNCQATFRLYRPASDAPFPVVLAAAWSDVHPRAAMGAACRPDVTSASIRALLEAAQVLSWLRYRPPRVPKDVRTFEDHADLYASAGGASMLVPFLEGDATHTAALQPVTPRVAPYTDDPASAAAAVMRAVEQLAVAGHEVLVADLTSPQVAATGFRVVRVLVTGMIDINADARWPRRGGTRSRGLPRRLGMRTRLLLERELNRQPVPLA